jgi:hypothetical protein
MPRDTTSPTLAPQHAFVVQFHADTHIESRHIRGRVEHVVSRQAALFQSLESLLNFMAQVLHKSGVSEPIDP